MMLGGPWPDEVWVSARVDSDGNPTTKASTDLISNTAGPFSPGSTDVELILAATSSSDTKDVTDDARLSGTIRLSDKLTVPEEGSVFVIVRSTPGNAGPPLAAVRLDAASLPTTFTVTDSDIMMGGPWPEEVWISARTDHDSNAMTKSEQDATSRLIGPLSSGATDVNLLLDM
jgi:hypothetical protein